jgi:hypothetical protein
MPPPNFFNLMDFYNPNCEDNPFLTGLGYEVFKRQAKNGHALPRMHVKLVGIDSLNTLDSAYFEYHDGEEKQAIEKCKQWLMDRGVKC